MTDEEEFFAWLDGELEGPAAARVEARVAADSALTAKAQAHRVLGARLLAAFDPVMETSAPDRNVAAPIDLAKARERLRSGRPSGVPQWAAIAATLIIGIGLGTAINGRGNEAPTAIENGRLVAAAGLGEALDRQLASADQDRAATRIGLTFRDHDGTLCRSFNGRVGTGLACRAGDKWQIKALYGPVSGADEYRAASAGNPQLGDLIDQLVEGSPLDAAQEREAQSRNWR